MDDPPPEMEMAMEMARKEGYTLVLGRDSNARSQLVGCEKTDRRGYIIEDLLVKYFLSFQNKGKIATCTAGNAGSIIDITIFSV